MSLFSKISFNENLTFIPVESPQTIDEALEMDNLEEDEDFEEEDEEEEEEEDEENVFENEICEDDDFVEEGGSIEVDEENNVLRFVRDKPREFIEQESTKPPFVKLGALTLPTLQDEDLPMVGNPIDPCSICMQRNCNTVILPCGDKEFCLCCVYENFTLRNQALSPLICPTCCGPITNVIRTKTKAMNI